MAARARAFGVALRPHAKTHKCVELGRRQLAHGACGLTVATPVEAEVFARAGVTDLTWAFPIAPAHIARVRRIAQETDATLRVVVDDLERERGLVFDGIRSHAGHAYQTRGPAEAARVAEEERAVMTEFAAALGREGIPVRGVSVGSTPAMVAAAALDGVTEARPGNYVFYDRTMVLIGCCEPADVGVTVLATVVSHQPGAAHFVVNAGALALSKDPGPAHVGPPAMGAVRDHPELTVAALSQEHGIIRAASPAAIEGRFRVGDTVELVPNHSCLAVAHFDWYHVVTGTADGGPGRVVDRWRVERGR